MLSKKLATVDKTRCVACGVCENKDGKAVANSVGYRPKSEIAAMVEGAR